MQRRRTVKVPASSANLGPGFDVLAAAVGLHMELEVVETGRFAVVTDLPIALDRRNLCVRAFERLHPADDFEFRITSGIPLSGGLGTSAAAIVAGLVAADHLFELDADLLTLATEVEGHPDNVAAALHGGIAICADGTATRLDAPTGLETVIVVPDEAVRTKEARAALPPEVPMGEAVFNAAHVALLVLGLTTGDYDLIGRGLKDALHQDRRAHLFPRSMDLVRRASELGAIGATISGAGPTVLFWTPYEGTPSLMEALRREAEGWAQVHRAPLETMGAHVIAVE